MANKVKAFAPAVVFLRRDVKVVGFRVRLKVFGFKTRVSHLLAMDVLDREVDVVEQLCMVLHRGAGAEEDHDLLVAVALQEGEEQKETLLGGHHTVALQQRDSRVGVWGAGLLR